MMRDTGHTQKNRLITWPGMMLPGMMFMTALLLWSAGCDDGATSSSVCGDGKVDSGEECDSGILVNRQCEDFGYRGGMLDCTRQCTYDFSGCIPMNCGDGVLDSGEECDAGQDNSDEPDAECRMNCHLAGCGDGIVDSGEECDAGQDNSDEPDAGCRMNCHLAGCGDGMVDSGEECDDGNDTGGDGCTECRISEFRVTSGTAQSRERASLAMGSDGRFVVVWQSDGQDSDGYGIYGRLYGSDGHPAAEEFQVNTHTQGDQERPSVAMGSDGRFVVVWQSGGQEGTGYGIYCRLYGPDGQPLGDGFQVNADVQGNQVQPAVAMGSDGGFVVVWQSSTQDAFAAGEIWGRLYGPDGQPLGDGFQVNTHTQGSQEQPAVAMGSDGGFVVVWQSDGQDGDGYGIYGRLYGPDGQPAGDEFQVNTGVMDQQTSPSAAMGSDGGFVVVWQSYVMENDSMYSIYGQLYDPDGTVLGSEFQVNTCTSGDQAWPSVAMGSDGRFVVVWMGWGQDGSDSTWGIHGQRYHTDGQRDGSEFHISSFVQDEQWSPSVSMAPDGRFVSAWQSGGQDGTSWDIFAQRYTADGTPIGSKQWP